MSISAPQNQKSTRSYLAETRGLDLVLAVGTAFNLPAPGVSFPISQFFIIALIAVGLTRRPIRPLQGHSGVLWLLFCALFYVALVSYGTPVSADASNWVNRILRMMSVVAVAAFLATGRVHFPSVLRGLTLGLALNLPAFYLGLTPDDYGGYLTGFVGDKNRAGMFYAVVGVLVTAITTSRGWRIAAVLAFAAPLWLTGSRTSLAAFAMGLLFVWLLAKRPPLVRWIGAAGIFWFVGYLEENFARVGAFADREGSDLLRQRIDTAVADKLARSSWFGEGLGEAYVKIESKLWFFHNSYDTLRVEGGWPFLVLIVLATVLAAMIPFKQEDRGFQGRAAQGACLALLVCALRLGEVFMTLPWALVVAAGLGSTILADLTDNPEQEGEPDVALL